MDLGSDNFSNAISCVSLAVSLLLAFLYIRDRRNAKYSIANEYSNQLLNWHGIVVEVLIELRSLSNGNRVENKEKHLIRLSALIEQGRFYFPNIKPDEYGVEKPPAYRGYRNVALDFLVASYNLHHKTVSKKMDKQAEHLQRLFTSVIYEIVRPSDRLKSIRELTDRYFVKDLSVEDLEEYDQIEAVSHMWHKPE